MDTQGYVWDDLMMKNNINISLEPANSVKALITGEPARVPNEKSFLFDIAAQ